MEQLERLQQWIDESDNIVFFGGAGVSTESGIPDFRSVDGLYHQQFAYPPEVMLSHTFYRQHPEEFFDFYRKKLLVSGAQPNAAHRKLAELVRAGKLRAVITQTIDGLHQLAGCREELELHGSTLRNYCERCGKAWDTSVVAGCGGVPRCDCRGVIRPDVVLYEEALNGETMYRAVDYIRRADVLIIGGTSLVVYPAAGLIDYYAGDKLVLINKSPTAMDARADLILSGPIGAILGAVRVG